MKVWDKSVRWHVSRLPGPLVDRLLNLAGRRIRPPEMTNHRGRTNCEIDKNLSGMKWTRIYSPFYSSDQFQAAIILWWGYISLRRSNNGKVSPSLLRAAQVTLTGLYTYNKVFKQCPTEFAKCLTFFAKCRAKGCQCELSQIIIATATKTTPQFFYQLIQTKHVLKHILHN